MSWFAGGHGRYRTQYRLGQGAICAVSEGDSDAWQVEDFDGARRGL